MSTYEAPTISTELLKQAVGNLESDLLSKYLAVTREAEVAHQERPRDVLSTMMEVGTGPPGFYGKNLFAPSVTRRK